MKVNVMLSKFIARLSVVMLVGLSFNVSGYAAEGGPSDQHVTTISEDRIWNTDITEPYWTEEAGNYTYYGLFLDSASTIDSYSVDSTISLSLEGLSGSNDFSRIYGIKCSEKTGKLQVVGEIDITGAGWMPLAEKAGERSIITPVVTGISSKSYEDLESQALISLLATGGTSVVTSSTFNKVYADAYASGISSNGAVSNVGDITITTRGGSVIADLSVPSDSRLSVSANAGVSGIHGDGAVINGGDVTIVARGGTAICSKAASRVRSYARADSVSRGTGIYSDRAVSHSGNITITTVGGTATASGAPASAYAHGTATGIYSDGAVTHTGNIAITTRGGTATAISTSIVNAFAGFTVNANATAAGISCGGDVTHSGDIKISISGGTAKASETNFASAEADAFASGIFSHGAVLNSGDITVAARGGAATVPAHDYSAANTSATANGILSSGGVVTNNGTINILAQAGIEKRDGRITSAEAKAYGIHFRKGATLSSSGLISASARFAPDVDPPSASAAPEAYQVFCDSGPLTVKQYAMEVGHAQGTFTAMYEGQIGTGNGGGVIFDNTELVVHILDDYQDGVFDIPRLWKQETEEQKKAQLNQFATAKAAIPDITVSLMPSTGVGTPQKIRLGYEPKESTPLKQTLAHIKVESQIHSIIQNNLAERFLSSILSAEAPPQSTVASFGIDDSTSNMVASLSDPNILPAVTTKEAKKHSLFFRPVYVNSYDSATAGYSSNTYGFVLGYDYKLSEKFDDAFIGVHAGYTRGDIRYTGTQYNKRKEFVDTYYGGVHGLSRFAEDFVFSGEASFFYTESEMRDDNPDLLGKADYNSIAIRAEAAVGYLWDISDHIIVPEIGLAYSWQHRDPFTTNNQNSPDVTYGTLDNNELYAIARVKWLKHYEVAKRWMITPLLGAGVTQVLTDGEISNTMRLGNATQLVVDQDENTTFTPEANITISNGDYYAIAGYTGGFGGTTKNNMFWLQLGFYF